MPDPPTPSPPPGALAPLRGVRAGPAQPEDFRLTRMPASESAGDAGLKIRSDCSAGAVLKRVARCDLACTITDVIPANDGLHDHAKGENMSAHPSRRQILRSTLASSGLGLAIGYPALTFAESAAPTPQCHDGDEATIRQTEGPYFKRSSPQRADLLEVPVV